jgi:hypothetical protein
VRGGAPGNSHGRSLSRGRGVESVRSPAVDGSRVAGTRQP